MNLVITSIENRIARIILNRPEKRNALGPELVDGLKAALAMLKDKDDCKVLILEAEGDVFSAGADLAYLKRLKDFSFEENLEDSNNLKELFEMIYYFPKPVIAKVQGHAIAGGCGLMSVCDFVIAANEAKFGFTEVRIGFIPSLVSVFLKRKLKPADLNELMLTGKLIDSTEAKRMGLINDFCSSSELNAKVNSLAKSLVENCSDSSLKMTKDLLHKLDGLSIEDGLKLAAELNAKARASDDCQAGISAFLDKEKLQW